MIHDAVNDTIHRMSRDMTHDKQHNTIHYMVHYTIPHMIHYKIHRKMNNAVNDTIHRMTCDMIHDKRHDTIHDTILEEKQNDSRYYYSLKFCQRFDWHDQVPLVLQKSDQRKKEKYIFSTTHTYDKTSEPNTFNLISFKHLSLKRILPTVSQIDSSLH